MKKIGFGFALLLMLLTVLVGNVTLTRAGDRQPIKAIYIPLADHYPGIIAHEKYRDAMLKADFSIERMKSWPLLRAYFESGEVDMAFIISPMAMDMFSESPNFRFISLLHRDGNALAINDLLDAWVQLPRERTARKPDGKVAAAFAEARKATGASIECAVPSLLATHTVILYKYLQDHGQTLALGFGPQKDVIAVTVPPAKSPAFIKKRNNRGIPASFEQSMPWADVVETNGFGKVAWYSKDVLPWPNGHVECIVIATDDAIKEKSEALQEVVGYLHRAGLDIEHARRRGGKELQGITRMINKHIPEHNQEAIVQSLRTDLNVINYRHLNVDKAGLKQIMDLAVAGDILKKGIDIEAFANENFSTSITEEEIQEPEVTFLGYGNGVTDNTKKQLVKQVEVLRKIAADPIIVRAVKEQNAEEMGLARIKAIDQEWLAGGQEPLVQELQANAVGVLLKEIIDTDLNLYTEAFVCDNQGAVVGEFPKTSDYWQGDEKKFTESFKAGKGSAFIGPLEFDESTQSFSVQLSVPIRDGAQAIGVLVFGIRNIK